MKKCFGCQQNLEFCCFSKNKSQADGLARTCKTCHNKYNKAHYQKRKSYYVAKAKKQSKNLREELKKLKEVPCKDCGNTYPWFCMDFDHLDSKQKKFNLGQALRFGSKKIRQEIAKCEIVCSNCHRIRTYVRQMFS